MKRKALVGGSVRCALLLAALALSAPVCLAQTGGGVRAEIASLLEAHDDALNRHNLEGVLALYAPGPNGSTPTS